MGATIIFKHSTGDQSVERITIISESYESILERIILAKQQNTFFQTERNGVKIAINPDHIRTIQERPE